MLNVSWKTHIFLIFTLISHSLLHLMSITVGEGIPNSSEIKAQVRNNFHTSYGLKLLNISTMLNCMGGKHVKLTTEIEICLWIHKDKGKAVVTQWKYWKHCMRRSLMLYHMMLLFCETVSAVFLKPRAHFGRESLFHHWMQKCLIVWKSIDLTPKTSNSSIKFSTRKTLFPFPKGHGPLKSWHCLKTVEITPAGGNVVPELPSQVCITAAGRRWEFQAFESSGHAIVLFMTL